MVEATPRMPWRLKVHNVEACNCSNGCGCQFNGFPDYGKCEAIVGYEVIEGLDCRVSPVELRRRTDEYPHLVWHHASATEFPKPCPHQMAFVCSACQHAYGG